jgi:hypothetical protein
MQFLQVALLGTLRKGVIAKMAYLAEFWLILESDLVEVPRKKYLMNRFETIKKNTTDYNITNTIGLTEFGSIMKKL